MTGAPKPLCLHVVTSLDFGGVETHMRLIAETSGQSRYEHAFAAIGRGGKAADRLQALGARTAILNAPVRIPSVTGLRRLLRLFRRLRPAVVHLHGSEANFHGIVAARMARVPVCLAEEVGLPRHSRKARAVFRRLYARADRVVAISEAVRRRIVDLGEAPASRISILPPPADLAASAQTAPKPGEPFTLGFVGRLEDIKNPGAVVEAVRLLAGEGHDVRARIVGDGSLRAGLEASVAAEGLSGRVTFAGYRERPFEALGPCHLYVQPSLTEGVGLAVVEAMSAGLPVLASAVGGVPEFIEDGVNGWLLPDPGAAALAGAVAEIIAVGPEVRAGVAARGRATAAERFAPAAYMRRADSLYDELASCGAALVQ